MKIAVYSIAKNEAKFVERWAESAKDADYLVLCDTGSSDETMTLAESAGALVHQKVFNPWRFDSSRNWSLSCVPEDADICIALDLDEVLVPGWRQALEVAFASGANRGKYKYIWSFNADGSPGVNFGATKIHSRHGFFWKYPAHEVLLALPGTVEKEVWVEGFEIHHFPDAAKSRRFYLDLLELGVQEEPKDGRSRYYLGREYYFAGQFDKAAKQLKAYLEISGWKAERSSACRILAVVEPNRRSHWLWQAMAEEPWRRENLFDLVKWAYEQKDWDLCHWAAKRGLKVAHPPADFATTPEAWSHLIHDFLAIASFHLGYFDEALNHGLIALASSPQDQRLQTNVDFYRKAIK